jgi:endonuclease G
MKYIISFFAALLLSTSVFAGPCSTMVPMGTPAVSTTEKVTLLCRKMYALAHSPSRHTAYWSAEHLVGAQQHADAVRVDAFKTDPNLPKAEAAKPTDYTGSGYDQGHMSPVGDMHIDPAAMLESFYMSNMVPQAPMNNRDGWNHLEFWVRGASMKYQDVYVITGPVYQCNPCQKIGKTKVAVPTHLYKVVYNPHNNNVITFLVPNVAFNETEIPKYISDIVTVQKLTGVTFFPGAKPGQLIETKQLWPIK